MKASGREASFDFLAPVNFRGPEFDQCRVWNSIGPQVANTNIANAGLSLIAGLWEVDVAACHVGAAGAPLVLRVYLFNPNLEEETIELLQTGDYATSDRAVFIARARRNEEIRVDTLSGFPVGCVSRGRIRIKFLGNPT